MDEKQSSAKLPESEKEQEKIIKLLEERLEKHDNSRKAVQDKLHEICERLRTQIDELEERINRELEDKFTPEDNKLQVALNEARGNSTIGTLQKAKAELLVFQSYNIIEDEEVDNDLTSLYELKAERRIIPELMESRKPTNVRAVGINRGRVSVQFTCFNPDEERVLSDHTIVNPVKYKCLLFKKRNEQESKKEYPLDKNEDNDSSFAFTPDFLEAETTYGTRIKMAFGDRENEWSDEVAEFTSPEFKKCCTWKKCPSDVHWGKKYSVDKKNLRIASKINGNDDCTIIGNTYIPHNTVTSWNIRIHKSGGNNGSIYIGVAPTDINQNDKYNYNKCGWYFNCYSSRLYSGPPHNYSGKEYGLRGKKGQNVHRGDSVGVVVDTTRGYLSFVLNGVNRGVAYCGIPLDKPLVPCVILYNGDSIELDISEAKENEADSFIPVPSNITAKSATWNSITLTWDKVVDASFYQIEMDGNKSWDATTASIFIKRGLLPETEHSFRVRTVRGSSVSEWSSVVKGKTLKAPEFSECVWEECPDNIDKKYSVDGKNPKIATKTNDGKYGGYCCTIIGNTYIPLNKATQWNIKILKSKDNDGNGIYIGIAPNNINQNVFNYNKCGWYFDCYSSILSSGPPHNYNKEYGPWKRNVYGQYVHTGDSVGVVVDTKKGELSFVLNGVNRGVAYEGIPLDKPLVPCVLLYWQGDSVEIII